MSHNDHRNDIRIGEDKWIEYVDLTGRYKDALEIDPIIEGLEPMLSALEVNCDAGCCGIDAFDFRPVHIQSAKESLRIQEVSTQLQLVRSRLESIDAPVFLSSRMNHYADRKVFIALLDHLQRQFMSGVDESA